MKFGTGGGRPFRRQGPQLSKNALGAQPTDDEIEEILATLTDEREIEITERKAPFEEAEAEEPDIRAILTDSEE